MMIRQEAVNNLRSESKDVRLNAARFFAQHAQPAEITFLTSSLLSETVPWIKRALERAIDRANHVASGAPVQPDQSSNSEPSAELVRDLRAEAVEEVAGTILHEFSPIIGSIKLSAEREFNNYSGSNTERSIEQLSSLLKAVRTLKQAAATPNYTTFDLAFLINEVVAMQSELVNQLLKKQGENSPINFRMAGAQPFMVEADRGQLHIALTNGLRNAIEAVAEWTRVQPPEIVVNWGRAGVENWLAILDTGKGFTGNPENALRLGNSNKRDHIGYGLATAQFAMRSIEGDVCVSNNPQGGAQFELRWYKDHANFIG